MPIAKVNGVDIAYEEAGSGFPLIWCHEFAGSKESWLPQVRFFARRYRVITYNARGYPPSQVPEDPAAYSQDNALEDCYGLLRHLGIAQAYVGGLSMGGSTALHMGIRHPEICRAVIISSAGSGSDDPETFRANSKLNAESMRSLGAAAFEEYGRSATRLQLQRKDPVGYGEFMDLLRAHSPLGSALTQLGVQGGRPPIYVWEKEMQAMTVPALILVGDEDEPCIKPSLFMKQHIPGAGLMVFPNSGHAINLEEPDLFNRAVLDFLTAVDLTPNPLSW